MLNGSLEPVLVLKGFYIHVKMKIEPFYRLSKWSLRSKMTFAVVRSFARKNKSIESKFRTLELFSLHMFLAAKAPASIQAVS